MAFFFIFQMIFYFFNFKEIKKNLNQYVFLSAQIF